MPDIEQGPINFSVIQPQTCERMVHDGQECPALTQVGILLRSSTSVGLFSSPTPHPTFPLIPFGFTQSIYQQLSALILSMLLMPREDFTDRHPSADGSSSPSGIRHFLLYSCMNAVSTVSHSLLIFIFLKR